MTGGTLAARPTCDHGNRTAARRQLVGPTSGADGDTPVLDREAPDANLRAPEMPEFEGDIGCLSAGGRVDTPPSGQRAEQSGWTAGQADGERAG